MEDEERHKSIHTVSRVLGDGSLVELVCDRWREKTALVHAHGTEVALHDALDLPDGRRLIPVPARNNLIRHGVLLLPEGVDEYGSVADLTRDIEAYITRYVDLSPDFLSITSAYVLLSWVYDAFNELPYLRFRGDYGSGKTRALLVVGSLLWKPLFASGASTISPIFHALDLFRGSLVVDESDFRMSDEKADLVKIMNNGNVRGFPVLRSQGSKDHQTYDPRAFHVYGPKVIAMRRSFDDTALESRFVTEEMGMRPLRAGIPLNLPESQAEEALSLRNRLLAYRFRTRDHVRIDPKQYASTLSPRTNQIIAPLLAVIESEAVRSQVKARMRESEAAVRSERSDSPEGQALSVVLSLIDGDDRGFLPVGEITETFIDRYGKEYERPITHRYIGHLLRTRLRLQTWKRHGTFVLGTKNREQLDLLAERYGVRG